jgi:hypothetical protein
MPWARRRNRIYFYRSFRVHGRAVRQYLGAGEAAAKEAAAIECRRCERQAQAAAAREYERDHAAAGAALDELVEVTDLLVKATLIDLGYHLHDRTWRRRRVRGNEQRSQPEGLPGGTAGDLGEGQPG